MFIRCTENGILIKLEPKQGYLSVSTGTPIKFNRGVKLINSFTQNLSYLSFTWYPRHLILRLSVNNFLSISIRTFWTGNIFCVKVTFENILNNNNLNWVQLYLFQSQDLISQKK